MIYLASPYSHVKQLVMDTRYEQAKQVTEILLKDQLPVFSPIVYGHHMASLGIDFRSWQTLNEAMIRKCDYALILTIEGWDKSAGIRHEMTLFEKLGKVVSYVNLHGEITDGPDN